MLGLMTDTRELSVVKQPPEIKSAHAGCLNVGDDAVAHEVSAFAAKNLLCGREARAPFKPRYEPAGALV